MELVTKLRKANLALVYLALNECLYVSILKLDNRLRVPKARLECFQSYNILAVVTSLQRPVTTKSTSVVGQY